MVQCFYVSRFIANEMAKTSFPGIKVEQIGQQFAEKSIGFWSATIARYPTIMSLPLSFYTAEMSCCSYSHYEVIDAKSWPLPTGLRHGCLTACTNMSHRRRVQDSKWRSGQQNLMFRCIKGDPKKRNGLRVSRTSTWGPAASVHRAMEVPQFLQIAWVSKSWFGWYKSEMESTFKLCHLASIPWHVHVALA